MRVRIPPGRFDFNSRPVAQMAEHLLFSSFCDLYGTICRNDESIPQENHETSSRVPNDESLQTPPTGSSGTARGLLGGLRADGFESRDLGSIRFRDLHAALNTNGNIPVPNSKSLQTFHDNGEVTGSNPVRSTATILLRAGSSMAEHYVNCFCNSYGFETHWQATGLHPTAQAYKLV